MAGVPRRPLGQEPAGSQSPVPLAIREAYAAKLREVMGERKVTCRKMAEDLDLGKSTVESWRTARSLPRLRISIIVADYLMSRDLRRLGVWVMPCDFCERDHEVIFGGQSRGRYYCSEKCASRGGRKRAREKDKRTNAKKRRDTFSHYRIVQEDSEARRIAILEHCLESAGDSKACPETPGCPFIGVTELPKLTSRRDRRPRS